MVVEDDGSLSVTFKEPAENRRVIFIALMLAMVLAVIASTAFVLAMLELRSSRLGAETRDRAAMVRDEQAAAERARLARELGEIRQEAARALGEQECRSIAFARQNSVEASADVIALELLTETVDQTFRGARGEQLQFEKLNEIVQRAREAVAGEQGANQIYREALSDCTAEEGD